MLNRIDPRQNPVKKHRRPQSTGFETARYFDELEARIVQQLHEEAMTDEARSALLKSTGINDPKLIDELAKLGITADELVVLRMLPLVMVAWAEDHADLDEREVVKSEAKRLGIEEDSTVWIILDTWLRIRPPALSVDAWKRYLKGSFRKISVDAKKRLIEVTRNQMLSVAKASGGHLGFGKVSKKEQTMIDRLTATMEHA